MNKKLFILLLIIPLVLVGCKKEEPKDKEEEVVDFLYAKTKDYGSVTVTGSLKNDLINDESTVVIENDDRIITINGFFDNGELLDGSIEVEYKDSNINIINKGSFKDGKLEGKGISEIKIDNYKLIRDGIFKEQKLNGMGLKKILYKDVAIQNARGIYENDKISTEE